MTSSPTIIEALAANLRQSAKSYFPGVEEAPVAILWTDPDTAWKPILPQMRQLLPELLTLGDYAPADRQGPVIWLKTALAGRIEGLELPKEYTPILYLPGVARHQLRNADQCPWELQPLVELLYRGVAWTHKNGRDWSVEGFFKAEDGLGLDLAQDEKTRLSLRSALGTIGQSSVSRLQGRRLEASDFDSLVIGDTPRDLLTWIGMGNAVRAEWGEERWHAFRSRCNDEFHFDPDKVDPLYAAERLGKREDDSWQGLWDRFCEAPAIYGGLRERLGQAQPTDQMAFDAEPWPQENAKREQQLGAALSGLANKSAHDARQKIAELEKAHASRRNWVWAKLGESPLAQALEFLYRLAEATRSLPSFSTLEAFSEWYAETGWQADLAMIDSLRSAGSDEAPVRAAIRSLYLPWLESLCSRFQELAANGLPVAAGIEPAEGECLLFVDGLRLDLAQRLVSELEKRHFALELQTRYAALPTVTATAKPAVSPIFEKLSGERIPPDFAPNQPDGKPLNQPRFLSLLRERSIEKIDESQTDPSSKTARGWCETGRIDSRGHDLGAELAQHLPGELSRVVNLVERLLASGWKSLRIITDHGWLLMPDGLEKSEMPGFLVESRWTRCASIKGQSVPDAPTVPWRWNPNESVVVAPAATSFRAGVEYSHGGVSPQECILPVIAVTASPGAHASQAPRILSIKWKRQRCTVEISNALPGLQIDLRRDGSNPASSVAAAIKEVEADGIVSLLVPDEALEGKTIVAVLISASNELLAKTDTIVGRKHISTD